MRRCSVGTPAPPLLPILNRYKPIGSTKYVDFLTSRPCYGTLSSHINQVVLDTASWEQSVAFRLEQSVLSGVARYYARTDGMEFTIPYQWFQTTRSYLPDFLVELSNGVTVVLEVKGHEDDEDRAKFEAAQRWVRAVNHWGELGQWTFMVCRNPNVLIEQLAKLAQTEAAHAAD